VKKPRALNFQPARCPDPGEDEMTQPIIGWENPSHVEISW